MRFIYYLSLSTELFNLNYPASQEEIPLVKLFSKELIKLDSIQWRIQTPSKIFEFQKTLMITWFAFKIKPVFELNLICTWM